VVTGRFRRRLVVLCPLLAAALLVSCGGDGDGAATGEAERSRPPNACPADGCRATITSATGAGGEVQLTFDANFDADLARNHFHVFWDTYTAEQVSDDAEPRFRVQQGNWVPTDDNPYTTSDEVSVKVRQGSTRLCVTAGDRNHNVIDPSIVDCRDVSDLL